MKRGLIVISIIIIIFSVVGGFAFIYFKTDILKSDKQLFFESFSNMQSEQILNKYFEKKMNEKCEFNGEITYNPIKESEVLDIVFKGSNDPENLMTEVNASLKYREEELIPVGYIKNDSLVGIKSDPIVKKHITVDYEKEPKNSLGIENKVRKIVEMPKINIIEEISFIKENYWLEINEKIGDEKFSKIVENEKNGYQLKMKVSEWIDIIEIIVDEKMVQRVNDKFGIEVTKDEIKEKLEEVQEEQDIEKQISVIAWENTKQGKENYEIRIENVFDVEIEKEYSNNDIKYEATITTKGDIGMEIMLQASFEGIDNLEKIKEKYSIQAELGTEEKNNTFGVGFNCEVRFVEKTEVTKLEYENTLMLTSNNDEAVKSFLNRVESATQKYVDKKIEELDIDTQSIAENNPITSFMSFFIYKKSLDVMENSLDEQKLATFNCKFMMYEGNKIRGTMVNSLLDTVIQNNLHNEEWQVELEVNGRWEGKKPNAENEVKLGPKSQSETGRALKESYYNISAEVDSEGRVYKIIIQEN